MKKSAALFLAIVMFLSLAACNGDNAPSPTADPSASPIPTTASPPPSPDNTFRVDVFWYDYDNTFLTVVRTAMQAEFDSYSSNIAVKMNDCQNDQALQNQMVQTAVNASCDLLVVNIVDTESEDAAMNIVDIARDAGIPIIFFNREVSDNVINSYDAACFVGTDPDEAGQKQGQAVAEFMQQNGNLARYDLNGDGRLSYIVLRGEHGSGENLRSRFSLLTANELLGAGTMTPSPVNEKSSLYDTDPRGENPDGYEEDKYFLYGNWQAAEAKKLMDTALTAYSLDSGDIEIILADNDDMALGAIESLNDKGYNTGADDKYIPVFGIDVTPDARQAIAEGKLTGTILQDAAGMGVNVVTLCRNVVSGAAVFDGASALGSVDSIANKLRIPYQIVK